MAIIQIPCIQCRVAASVEDDATAAFCPSCAAALPPPAARAWLLTRDGSQPFGPYTIAELIAFIAERRILPSDEIWHDGAAVRIAVRQLPPLTSVQPQPQPQPQPEAQPQPEPQPASVAPTPEQSAVQPQPDPAPAVTEAPAPITAPAPVAAPAPAAVYYAAPQGSPAGQRVGLHLKRAINWNLRSLPVEPDEEALLLANGVDEVDARRYLVWRRSVLLVVAIPTLISALLATLTVLTTDHRAFTAIGVALDIARLAALYALPLTAWLAARAWASHRRSRAILLRGWLFAFLTPLVLALVPFSWRIDLSASGGDTNVIGQANAVLGLIGAISVYVTLMPSVLSLIPGVLRGCLRIKALLPESILPGLFLVAATPLYVLLFLVIFTTVNQVAGNLLLILGVLALLAAPLLYLINARTFTRPLRTPEDIAKVGQVQTMATIIIGIGLALIVTYVFTAEIFNRSLVGLDEQTSIMRPWSPSLIQFPIEYFVRSLFTTVLVADIFMLMNLSLWRHTKDFQATPEAASYDRLMSEIEEAGGATQSTVAPTA